MTATEMANQFRQRANCVNNYTVSTNAIQTLLNQAGDSLVRELAAGRYQRPNQRSSDNDSKFNDDALAPLRKSFLSDTDSSGFLAFPQNHMFLETVEVKYPKCYKDGRDKYIFATRTVPNEIAERTIDAEGTFNEATWNKDTNPNTPSVYLYNPYYLVTGNTMPAGITIVPSYKYTVRLRYLCEMPEILVKTPALEAAVNATNPVFVVVPADVNCVLPEFLHSEIVDRAVMYFNRAGGNYTDMQADKMMVDSGLS